MGLFSTIPVDEVTVLDIAQAADVTSAAVYYHFPAREQILLHGMQRFFDAMIDDLRQVSASAQPSLGVHDVLVHEMGWIQKHRVNSLVYFVSSIGLNMQVEALRREGRIEMIEILSEVARRARGRLSRADTGMIALGLVSLIETSAASMLNQDVTFQSLGARGFAKTVGDIGSRMAGVEVVMDSRSRQRSKSR